MAPKALMMQPCFLKDQVSVHIGMCVCTFKKCENFCKVFSVVYWTFYTMIQHKVIHSCRRKFHFVFNK